jgi:hypothetical protein
MYQDEMSNLNRGHFIDASSHVSFHLKPLGQMKGNMAGSIYEMSSIKIAHIFPIC